MTEQLRRRSRSRLVWIGLVACSVACECGVKTVESSGGITLVEPPGPVSEVVRSISFGVVRVSVTASQPIELRNDARESIAITSFALSSNSSPNYFLKLPAGALPMLQPGQTLTAQLRYQPSAIATDTGTVNITTASPLTPKYTINVTGSGGASKIDVCTTGATPLCAQEQPNGMLTIDMGTVTPPGHSTQQLTVKSIGTLPLNLMSAETTPSTPLDYSLKAGPFPVSIPVQQDESYSVTFTPSLGGTESGTIEFDSDDPITPRLLVYLTAVGDAPRLCVSPTTVNFGAVPLGTTATQPLTITSCGAEPLTLPADLGSVANISVTNDGSGSATATPVLFAEPQPPTLPQTLPAGQSIMVNFTFAPVAFGAATGLAVVGSADGERGQVSLVGSGVGCSLIAVPSPVNFGQVPTGSSTSDSVNVSNTGTGPCTIASFAIQGGASSPFSIPTPPTTPVTLMPGQSQAVNVSFTPASTTAASDDLVVTANTASPLLVPLQATGITPPPCLLEPTPTSLVFANVEAGQNATQNVTLTNVGTTDCYVTGESFSAANGASTAPFTATVTGAAAMMGGGFAPVDVPAAGTLVVKVGFAPTSSSQLSAILDVDYGPMDIPEIPPLIVSPDHVHVPVTGGEAQPQICIMPTSINFGTVAVGQTPTKTFTITSCGPGTLLLRGLMMGGGSSPRFTITSQVSLPDYLPSGATLNVNVQYAPTTTTGDFGDVVVLSNDPTTPHASVPLQGNASAPCATQLACGVSPLVFATIPLGDTAPLSLTCINVGTQPVTVSGVSFGSQSTAFTSPGLPAPQTVPPGGTVRIEIDFTPQQAGSDSGSVTLTSSSCSPVTVALSGAGVVPTFPICPPAATFSPMVKWNWTGGSTQPSSNNVEMSPIVANLTDDNGDGRIDQNDIPDVVFTSCTAAGCCLNCLDVMNFDEADFSGIGMMRGVHGKTGGDLFAVTDPTLALTANTQIATADLDGDNLPEIIAVQHTFHQGSGMLGLTGKYVAGVLLIFDHTGKLEFQTDQWTGDPTSFEFASAPAIADLDGDGQPEIVFERTVFHSDGTKWYDMSKSGNWGHGSFPTISDVNGDGKPDIVSGNLVYSAAGTLEWTAPSSLAAGPTMVLDLNGDGEPEVILRDTAQSVQVLNGKTGAVMASATWQPPASNSNDPTEQSNGICSAHMAAADLDGDGTPELIIPAGDFIYTWKYVGTSTLSMLWQQPISDYDGQCGASGAAAFDFNGQGKFDVVYHDTEYLYIYRGTDGTLMYEQPRSSDTIFETPVIADIDNDGHADILMTNNVGGGSVMGTLAGVVALSNTGNSWPEARHVWSDHAYHMSEIGVNDLVPVVENWSWEPGNNNNWRAQTPQCTP